MPAYAKLMIAHALALFGGAAVSFLGGGWDAGKTGIIICAVTGLLMLVMALLSAAKAKAALMIGIHGGLVLSALYTLMFGYTAVSRWIKYAGEEDTPFYLPALLTALAVISALVFVGLIRLRPAPGERGAGGGAQTGRPSPEAG
jgi:hypothetical protein